MDNKEDTFLGDLSTVTQNILVGVKYSKFEF